MAFSICACFILHLGLVAAELTLCGWSACSNQCLCFVQNGQPEVIIGSTSKQPVLDVSPETFTLRKLLPQTAEYDFNIHIMDFRPGEYLYVKVRSTCT